ncbi:hypothetical protein [Actinophytocola xanthii]|uniref:DUF5671 domain-containing protein n=1 Tax=Actinophytocola xanthii TaxID=1912961 RepID=A0A1Q8CX17_9PSEU|nr:hypothetical protein [Actinophytocola xanthii]OLF18906.1 hypothetical protein BU204_03330 [Actinophytocola xanthii]
MEFIGQILAMLGSIAAVLGVVISYLQYRANRERYRAFPPPAPHSPPPSTPRSPHAGPGAWPPPAAPPTPVRIASAWVVVDSLVVVGLLFALFAVVVENRYGFGFAVPPLPEAVLWLVPLVLAGLVGLVAVPRAVRRAGGLRHGDPRVRGKLLGMAAVDLFVGVILAAVVLSLEGMSVSVPEPVYATLAWYIGYRIVSGLVDVVLLTHRDTRTWMDVSRAPAGRW